MNMLEQLPWYYGTIAFVMSLALVAVEMWYLTRERANE